MSDLRNMPESYWKERLTPEQYKVVRQRGTERAFTGALTSTRLRTTIEIIMTITALSPIVRSS